MSRPVYICKVLLLSVLVISSEPQRDYVFLIRSTVIAEHVWMIHTIRTVTAQQVKGSEDWHSFLTHVGG